MSVNCLGPEERDSENRFWQIVKIVLGTDNIKQSFLSAGQKTAAESISVVLASDNFPSISPSPVTRTDTAVTLPTGASAVILAGNSDRVGGWIQNISSSTVWLSHGGTAGANTGVMLTTEGVHHLVSAAGVTQQAISAYQASGGDITLLTVEEELA